LVVIPILTDDFSFYSENVSYFKDIADGRHRTRDISTRTVARKLQTLSGDTQVDAVQLRVSRNDSCYKLKKHSTRSHRNSHNVFVCIPQLPAIILRVSFFP
jgi:hypothetical protein